MEISSTQILQLSLLLLPYTAVAYFIGFLFYSSALGLYHHILRPSLSAFLRFARFLICLPASIISLSHAILRLARQLTLSFVLTAFDIISLPFKVIYYFFQTLLHYLSTTISAAFVLSISLPTTVWDFFTQRFVALFHSIPPDSKLPTGFVIDIPRIRSPKDLSNYSISSSISQRSQQGGYYYSASHPQTLQPELLPIPRIPSTTSSKSTVNYRPITERVGKFSPCPCLSLSPVTAVSSTTSSVLRSSSSAHSYLDTASSLRACSSPSGNEVSTPLTSPETSPISSELLHRFMRPTAASRSRSSPQTSVQHT
ncbi:uncharacterized protein V1516DRAFT_232783, partial [Lipomyces oligophaga]|uniref:uncharacterized protein n=1 Tax=Lipomyces oligophaga TaxID=45792 RepID=UPI0034CEBD9F